MLVQRCLISKSNDPYLNLSTEEYYLRYTEDELFMLYINEPSVVVGKHQNLLRETNIPWAYEHNIKLCRRLSGGGTVYQDFGNLNFSFIKFCPNLEKVNYKRFTSSIVLSLNSLGINAENSERNDLLINGFKISGNAMHIYKNRVLCHGTLLYNSELKDLSLALLNNSHRYVDKAIRSVSSKVTNISQYLTPDISMHEFMDTLFRTTMRFLESPVIYSPAENEMNEIEKIKNEKYAAWDWIYGYSPKYTFIGELKLKGENFPFQLLIEKGIIKDINYPPKNNNILFIKNLTNIKHDYSSIRNFLIQEKIQESLVDYSIDELCRLFF